MAAIMTAFFTFARPGSSIVYTAPLYGGTTSLIHQFLQPFGVTPVPVLGGDTEAIRRTIETTADPSIVLVETPANPTLVMTDLRAAAEAAHGHPSRPVVMVDNTFLGPVFQHPLLLGADLALYSATKYLSGFSDMVAGVAVSGDPALIQRMKGRRSLFGNILQPDECWMLDGRLPTVSLRMNRQSKNAQRLAEGLNGHRKIRRVLYPTLFDDPEQIRIFRAQCDFPGGIFSLDLGGRQAAFTFLRNVRIAKNAVSLGGVETLTCHPKTTTHSGMSSRELEEAGISDGLVRVSVGIEHWRDREREWISSRISFFSLTSASAISTCPSDCRTGAGCRRAAGGRWPRSRGPGPVPPSKASFRLSLISDSWMLSTSGCRRVILFAAVKTAA
jgi:cystathionine beta-lyase/cystathionine gamma-synthase